MVQVPLIRLQCGMFWLWEDVKSEWFAEKL